MLAAQITALAYIADWLIGDPQHWPHPVRWIGRLINGLESFARRRAGSDQARLRLAGMLLAVATIIITMTTVWLILFVAAWLWTPLWFLVTLYLVYAGLCLKELYRQSWKVEKKLSAGLIEEARQSLSWIVGRDTKQLDEAAIRRATIETLAENLSDGMVAPMFYLALGGPVLAWAFKAVNTMDSMLGYKNEKYLHLGRFAAKLDDVANYLPARLTALLLIFSAGIQGHNWRGAKDAWLRDGKLHSSPNSGQPEAAMAGALDIWLGGPSYYGGTLFPKPIINDGTGEANADKLKAAENIMVGAAVLMLVLVALFLILITGIWGWS